MNTDDYIKQELSNFPRWRSEELLPFVQANIIRVPYLANYALRRACFIGDLPTVDYLLTNPILYNGQANATIHDRKMDHTKETSAFVCACQSGNTQLIDYLLCSPKLLEHAHICEGSIFGPYSAFAELAVLGDTNTIDFLLQHKTFPQQEYPQVMDVVVRGLLSQSHHHTYSHIVSQYGITLDNIKNALDLIAQDYGNTDPLKIPQLPVFPQAVILQEMVESRDLYYQMQCDLPVMANTLPKRKI